jgi:preprotein translocase subunit SecA
MSPFGNDERFERKRKKEEAYRKTLPGADDQPLPPPVESIRSESKPKRNDPCPCGSGKKYKQCCALKN